MPRSRTCPRCGHNPGTDHLGMQDELLMARLGCRKVLKAVDELMAEFISKKRAADWAIINDGLLAAEKESRKVTR